MATNLSVQKATLSGLNAAYTAADATGNTFQNTGVETVRVKATSNPVTVTVQGVGACSHGVVHNSNPINVPAGEEREIGPFADLKRWNNSQNRVTITYNQVVGVSVAAVSQ